MYDPRLSVHVNGTYALLAPVICSDTSSALPEHVADDRHTSANTFIPPSVLKITDAELDVG
jgi:hypothetical protein